MDNEQLYKRQNGNYKEVYPNTLLSSILDKQSGKSLKDIISAYNHLYVPFVNNIYETLTAIPVFIRRKGLWVTWETEDGINTYQFNLSTAEAVDDAIWGNIESWEQVPDLDYYNTHAAVPNGSITLEKLSDEVRQWLVDAGKIINYADEEDITEQVGLLKLADRPKVSGVNSMGYKILRRNKSFAEQVTEENTIYEIKYDFNLDGESITIPYGCILYFNSGSLKNGTLIGTNTFIEGFYIFKDFHFDGTFENENINITTSNFLGDIDIETILFSFYKAKIYLYKDITQTTLQNKQLFHLDIEGNGYTITMPKPTFRTNVNGENIYIVYINNTIFDFSLISSTTGEFISLNGNYNVIIQNCKFIGNYRAIFCERCINPTILNNEIYGTLDETVSQTFGDGDCAIGFYSCKKIIRCEGNRIHDINMGAILMTCAIAELQTNTKFLINNNEIVNTGGYGFKTWGGCIYNCFIQNNFVKNVNCFNLGGNGTNRAPLNLHGFVNLIISNNIFSDCLNGNTFDLEGLDEPEEGVFTQDRGQNLIIENNKIVNSQLVVISRCKHVLFRNNVLENLISPLNIIGTTDLEIYNNNIIQNPSSYYKVPIAFGYNSNNLFDVKKCHIENNTIQHSIPVEDISGESSSDSYLRRTCAMRFLELNSYYSSTNDILIRNNYARNTNYPTKPLTISNSRDIVSLTLVNLKRETYKKYFTLKSGEKVNIWKSPYIRSEMISNYYLSWNQYCEIKRIKIEGIESEYYSGYINIGRCKYGTVADDTKLFSQSFTGNFQQGFLIDLNTQENLFKLIKNNWLYNAIYLSLGSEFTINSFLTICVEYIADDSRLFQYWLESDS